jgi:ABC-type multidrug transport system fused ATPase/permease subunit
VRNVWRAIRFIPEYRSRIIAVVLVGGVLGAIGAGTPFLFKHIVDTITALLAGGLSRDAAGRSIGVLIAGFFALRLALVVLGAVQGRQADYVWLDTVSTFRQRVFETMTRLSIDYFERTRTGEIMDRFATIPSITQWLFSLTESTLATMLQMIFILGVLLARVPAVGLIMSTVLAINFAVSHRTVYWTRPYRRGWQVLAGRMTGLLAEMIGNISTVRSFGAEPAVQRRYDATQAEWMIVRGRLHEVEWRSTLSLNIVNAIGVFISVTLVARGALREQYGGGDILLVLMLTQNLINTITPISRQINQAGDVEASAERLVELLGADTELADRPDAVVIDHIESIVFDRVTFRYRGKPTPALDQVSFRLERGQTLALVGPSGGGKTTLVKLLMRLYDPDEGRILINGRDLREYRQHSLRALTGVVLQDVALFNDSIGENISFARADATAQAVRAAARAAHADVFVERLPEGYDTLVGERGIKLSGGEKQRIAIARALLKDPQLVVLDEATSALDSESEHLVQQGLEELVAGRSTVVIAHRLSTIMNADQILLLHEGRVQESGRHAELIRNGGLYARLFALQAGGRLTVAG